MPLFSIVVPTYDRVDLLEQALNSVGAQECEDFECIVVEDAPPTPVATVPADPRFRLIRHNSNQGVAAARNTGLEHAQGRYVTFLDDDDLMTPDRLSRLRGLVSPDYVVVCGRGRLDRSPAHYRELQGDVRNSILNGFTPHLGQTAMPRDMCPFFDVRYRALEDVEWWLRVSHLFPVLSTPEIGYLMRTHPGVRHNNGKSVRAESSRLLLADYAEYFRIHRRARAFRLDRLARLELGLGRRDEAREAAWRAVSTRPGVRSVSLAMRLSTPTLQSHRSTI